MNKEEAQKQLNNLQKEVDKLKKIIETPERHWSQVIDFYTACYFRQENPGYFIDKWEQASLTEQQISGLKLEYCIKAINEDWKPNWKNSSECKYYNWFQYSSGGGFGLYASGGYSSLISTGSSFYYESKEKALHGSKYFIELYKSWMS